MRLLKAVALLIFGYLLYEFVQGMLHGPAQGRMSEEEVRSRDLERALNRNPGRMNVTGPGRGAIVQTEDFEGGRSNRIVGRGVVES